MICEQNECALQDLARLPTVPRRGKAHVQRRRQVFGPTQQRPCERQQHIARLLFQHGRRAAIRGSVLTRAPCESDEGSVQRCDTPALVNPRSGSGRAWRASRGCRARHLIPTPKQSCNLLEGPGLRQQYGVLTSIPEAAGGHCRHS